MYSYKRKLEGPYNFDQVLNRLAMDPLNAVHLENKEVTVPFFQKNKPTVVKIKSIGTFTDPEFEIESEAILPEHLQDKIERTFHWDRPLHEIQAHFASTHLAPIFQQHEGTPIVLDYEPYNCLMKCFIHQQLNLKFAHTLTERFVHTFGFQHEGVWFYPTPEKIAALDYEDLTSMQFSRRKAEYIIDTSRLIATGELPLDEIVLQSDEEIMKALIKVRGIGPWTVQNLLLFGLGRPNLFPLADIGIQNALKKLFELPEKPTQAQMLAWTKDWEPYLSYASLYLWRSIE